MKTDATSVVIPLESMMYGQNRQTACEACFTDSQLVITTKSDLTGTCLICPLIGDHRSSTDYNL